MKDFPSIQSFLGYFESRIVNFWHIKAKYLAPQLLDFGFTGGAGNFTGGGCSPPVNMLEEALEHSHKLQRSNIFILTAQGMIFVFTQYL